MSSFCFRTLNTDILSSCFLLISLHNLLFFGFLVRMASSSGLHGNAMDRIILKVADALTDNIHIEKLGKELGVSVPDVTRAIETNHQGASVTSYGTLCMLRSWAEGVRASDQLTRLTTALQRAGLQRIADDISGGGKHGGK